MKANRMTLVFGILLALSFVGCGDSPAYHPPLNFVKCQEGIKLWWWWSSEENVQHDPNNAHFAPFWKQLDQVCATEIKAGGNPFVDTILNDVDDPYEGYFANFLYHLPGGSGDVTGKEDLLPRSRQLHYLAAADRIRLEGFAAIPTYLEKKGTIYNDIIAAGINDRCRNDANRRADLTDDEVREVGAMCDTGNIREVMWMEQDRRWKAKKSM